MPTASAPSTTGSTPNIRATSTTCASSTRATCASRTLPHGGHNTRLGGIGGNPVDGEAHDHLDPPDNLGNASGLGLADNSALCPGGTPPATTVEPVDGALRGFRAYYPLWLPGSNKNFNAVAGST